jgi:hypothetical protein
MVATLYRMYRGELLSAWFHIGLYSVFALLGPAFFMQQLITYAGGSFSLGYGLFLAFGMMFRYARVIAPALDALFDLLSFFRYLGCFVLKTGALMSYVCLRRETFVRRENLFKNQQYLC